jgi:hypothetical protein
VGAVHHNGLSNTMFNPFHGAAEIARHSPSVIVVSQPVVYAGQAPVYGDGLQAMIAARRQAAYERQIYGGGGDMMVQEQGFGSQYVAMQHYKQQHDAEVRAEREQRRRAEELHDRQEAAAKAENKHVEKELDARRDDAKQALHELGIERKGFLGIGGNTDSDKYDKIVESYAHGGGIPQNVQDKIEQIVTKRENAQHAAADKVERDEERADRHRALSDRGYSTDPNDAHVAGRNYVDPAHMKRMIEGVDPLPDHGTQARYDQLHEARHPGPHAAAYTETSNHAFDVKVREYADHSTVETYGHGASVRRDAEGHVVGLVVRDNGWHMTHPEDSRVRVSVDQETGVTTYTNGRGDKLVEQAGRDSAIRSHDGHTVWGLPQPAHHEPEPLAVLSLPGAVKLDSPTVTKDADGTIHAVGKDGWSMTSYKDGTVVERDAKNEVRAFKGPHETSFEAAVPSKDGDTVTYTTKSGYKVVDFSTGATFVQDHHGAYIGPVSGDHKSPHAAIAKADPATPAADPDALATPTSLEATEAKKDDPKQKGHGAKPHDPKVAHKDEPHHDEKAPVKAAPVDAAQHELREQAFKASGFMVGQDKKGHDFAVDKKGKHIDLDVAENHLPPAVQKKLHELVAKKHDADKVEPAQPEVAPLQGHPKRTSEMADAAMKDEQGALQFIKGMQAMFALFSGMSGGGGLHAPHQDAPTVVQNTRPKVGGQGMTA